MKLRQVIRLGVSAVVACLLLAAAASAAPTPPDPGPVAIPATPLVVKVRPALLGRHPRLFFDASGLAALKAKTDDPRLAEMRQAFLANADQLAKRTLPAEAPLTEDPTRTYGDGLCALSFAYLLTGDPRYLAAARGWVQALVSYSTWAGDEDLGAGHCAFGLALAYDWLYDQWTPDERKSIEGALTRHLRLLMRRSAMPPSSNGFWGSAYFQNHNWINNTGTCAAAWALYDTAPGEMQSYLDHVRSVIEITYRHLGTDGGSHEGPAYAGYGTNWLMYYFDLLKGMDGEDLYDMPYMRGLGRYFVYNLMPDARSLVNFGDCFDKGGDALEGQVLYKLAARYQDGHVEWLRRRNQSAREAVAKSNATHRSYFGNPFCLIWCDPEVQPKAPDDLPLTGTFDDLGLAICRDRWADDASVVAMLSGPPGGRHLMQIYPSLPHANVSFGHTHPNANAFLFWTRGRWVVANPAGYTHDKQTRNENVWTIGDKGQRGTAEWFDARSYVGDVPQAHLVQVVDTLSVDCVVGEAAAAYERSAGLREFRRCLVFVKSAHPYVVVYDRLATATPDIFTSYLHAYDEFTVSPGNRFTLGAKPSAFGTLLGAASFVLKPTPFRVLSHPDKTSKEAGFQLAASTTTPTTSTWLITVLSAEELPAQLGDSPAPSVNVGGNKIIFQNDGGILFDGKLLAGKQ